MVIGVFECPPVDCDPYADEARRLDRALVKIARSAGAIELALGEALARLFDQDGLIQVGYSRREDYARERLGVPPRTMFGWVRLARALVDRPLLKRAVVAGLVSPRKASIVSPLAVGDGEPLWVGAAMQLSVVELQRAVRAEGADVDTGYGAVETMILRMAPEHQKRLDEALVLAAEQTGYAAARWQCMEIVCQEWLGEFGFWQPDSEEPIPDLDVPGEHELSEAVRAGAAAIVKQLDAVELAADGPACHESSRDLDARIQKLLEGRRAFDVAFGAAAARVVSRNIWPALGYHGVEEYCRERLGVSPRSFRERLWLERRMCALPQLRDALASGKLTFSKALLVARDARPWDVAERIENAASTTWQQTERESTEEEDRRNCAAGVRRLWGPEDAVRTMTDAIVSAQAVALESGLGEIDAGEALALVATHFLDVWRAHAKRKPPASRVEILTRHHGLCAVPGCSSPAHQAHHIHYRSRGGSDKVSNRLGLCVQHHLRGIHQGYLTVAGAAGERLEWHFGNGEEWVTIGNDDVSVRHPFEVEF